MIMKIKKAAAVLSLAVGGLGLTNAILSWVSLGGNNAGTGYIISSVLVAVGCSCLIVFGILLLIGKMAEKILAPILIAASALSSVMFANLVQSILTVAAVAALIACLVTLEAQEKTAQKNDENIESK